MIATDDPRLTNPKFRALLTYNSVHTARAAAKAFADATGSLLPVPTNVILPSLARLQFMRVRDEADARLIDGLDYQHVEIVEAPDVSACRAMLQARCKASDGIEGSFSEPV